MARDYPDNFQPTPIDRVAGRVLSTGVHHEFAKTDDDREVWDIVPEVVPLRLVPPTIQVLFGTRKGSLLVVGYLGRPRTKGGNQKEQRLLVRCDCGRYEVRNARRWRSRVGGNDYCQFCAKREGLKLRHLSSSERDREINLQRARKGLPSLSEMEKANNQRRKENTERMLGELLNQRSKT